MNCQVVLMKALVCLGIVGLFFLGGCGSGTSHSLNNQSPNPGPTISSLRPSSAQVGGQAFILSVVGSNFVSSSVVRWNGSDRPTTLDNSGQLSAQVAASDIATVGTAVITVFNPMPSGGDTSNAVNFTTMNNGTNNNGTNPSSVAVAPDPTGKFGKFAYVTNFASNNVSMYGIDAATGALKFIGTVAAGSSPISVAVDRSGKFTYVANNFSHNVSMYSINATTGILTSMGTIAITGRATSVTVDPSGKFAYVGEGYPASDTVWMYTINASTGALTPVGTIGTGSPANSIAVKIAIDPSGKFAYVAGDGCALDTYSGYVSVYTISPTTGALTPIGLPVIAGDCAGSVTIDPFGKFAYLANQADDNVSMYTIDATTGVITLIGTIPAKLGPTSVAVDPAGKFAYVTNCYDGAYGHDVSMYTINASSGELTPIGTIAAGSGPCSIAIDPSGKFAYVTNSDSNNVSMYGIDSTTGALTLIGTIGT